MWSRACSSDRDEGKHTRKEPSRMMKENRSIKHEKTHQKDLMSGYEERELGDMLSVSAQARFLKKHGMISAALFYKDMNSSKDLRFARVTRWALEKIPMPELTPGQRLFSGIKNSVDARIAEDDVNDFGFRFSASGEGCFDTAKMRRLYDVCENTAQRHMTDLFLRRAEADGTLCCPSRYLHGGIHNVPDFSRVLKTGFTGILADAEKRLRENTDILSEDFFEAMRLTAEGVVIYIKRAADYTEKLAACDKSFSGLAEALRSLSEGAPGNFYEAYLAMDLTMFFTNYEPGRMDVLLFPFYEKDLKEKRTSREEALSLFEEMFDNISEGLGHPAAVHMTAGGSLADGSPAYNELTTLAVIAIRGKRQPNMTLRVRRDMPDELWNEVIYNIGKGFGQPALVSEELYLEALTKDYSIPFSDASDYAFGGCSELLIQGKTFVNSTWTAYNMLDILENTIYNRICECGCFGEFLSEYKRDILKTLDELAGNIRIREFSLSQNAAYTLRSLFSSGCLDNAAGFCDGGCEYNFDSTNIYGTSNAVNSLVTIKAAYEGKLHFGVRELAEALAVNFEGHQDILSVCLNSGKIGNDCPEAESIAHDIMTLVFDELMKKHTWRENAIYRGRFMPTIVPWVDWITCGEKVGATPDGRRDSEALCDSAGPSQGSDRKGPTAAMTAILSIPQNKCAGTCVMNLRLDKTCFETESMRKKVRTLLSGYLENGGCQLQINVADTQLLRKAMENPEKHGDIIVRVGGFSDNFVRLDRKIQTEIIKRTEHDV